MHPEHKKLLEQFTNQEIIDMVNELQGMTIADDSPVRKLCKDIFGDFSLTRVAGVAGMLAVELCERVQELEKQISNLRWEATQSQSQLGID